MILYKSIRQSKENLSPGENMQQINFLHLSRMLGGTNPKHPGTFTDDEKSAYKIFLSTLPEIGQVFTFKRLKSKTNEISSLF